MKNTTNENQYIFLQGGGEMGELIRNYDWSKTPLGSPDTWPQSLRTSVGIVISSAFPMLLWWGDDLTQFYNDAFRPSLGIEGKHPAALGKPAIGYWKENWHVIKPLIDKVMLYGEPSYFEDLPIPNFRNGRIEEVYWTFSYSPVRNESGVPVAVLMTCFETTPQVLQRRHLEESEARFRTLIEKAISPVFILKGEDMVLEMANQPLFDAWEVGHEAIGKTFLEILPEMKDQPFLGWMRQVYHRGEPISKKEIPAHFVRRNNRIDTRYWDFVYQPYFERDGTLSGVLAQATEITGQVAARKTLEESEFRFRSLIEEAPVATCLFVGPEMRVEVINQMMVQAWGKDFSVLQKPLIEALPELKGQPFLDILADVYATGKEYKASAAPVDLVIDGRLDTYYYDFTYKPLLNEDGRVWAIINVSINVTDRVLGIKRLEQSEARFRSLIEAAPVATCLFVGKDLIIEVANEAMITYMGKGHSVIGKPLAEAIPELKGQAFLQILEDIFTTGETFQAGSAPAQLQVNGVLETFYFNYTFKPLKNEKGEVYGIMDMSVDVTDQVLARQEIENVVAQRTRELGDANEALQIMNKELQRSNHHLEEFAHAASHDLKEPIRKIHFFTEQLKQQLQGQISERQAQTFTRITNSTHRMGLLVDDLLLYSHVSQRPHEKELVDLNTKLQLVLEDLELDIQQKNATFEVHPLPIIDGYGRQLQQLFQNLISNALKYSKTDIPPHITITSTQTNKQGHQYQCVEFSDNGIGFEEQYSEKIFQMFSRLHGKHEYSGTGVGLSIVKKVVENHNGSIEVRSKQGVGSTFRICLP